MCITQLFVQAHIRKHKARVTGLCEGNPPVTGGFPSQRARNGGIVSFRDVIMTFIHIELLLLPLTVFLLFANKLTRFTAANKQILALCFRALEYTVEGQVVIGTPRMSLNLSRKHRWFWRTATVNLTEVYRKPHRIRMLEGRIVRSRKVSNTRN